MYINEVSTTLILKSLYEEQRPETNSSRNEEEFLVIWHFGIKCLYIVTVGVPTMDKQIEGKFRTRMIV